MDTEKLARKRAEAEEQVAESYLSPKSPYAKYMKALDNSPLQKVRPHGLTALDYANCGKMLEQFDTWLEVTHGVKASKLNEDDGNIASLGTYPNVALDALTVTFGSSPINVIASVQPIDEVQGLVYFRDFVAQNNRGNVSSGQNLISTLQVPDVFPVGFASDTVIGASVVEDSSPASSPNTYTNVALAGDADFGKPINPQTVVLSGSAVTSDGTATFSNIVPNPSTGAFSQVAQAGSSSYWISIYGVLNFANGTVTFTVAPTHATLTHVVLNANYQTVEEDNTDLQKAIVVLQTKQIRARLFALKSTIGLAESYMLRKRFGISLEEEIARDLTVMINQEIVNTAIGILLSNLPTSISGENAVTWTRQPQNGVGYFEHQLTIKNAMTDASAKLFKTAGRGNVNCWIAGLEVCAILQNLPGFNKVFDDMTFGPHIFGTMDGVTIVRVPYSSILDDNTMIGICKGNSAFEAPLVYAPYMPLEITNTLPMAYNPLQQQRACVHWAGLDPLVSNLSTEMIVSETDFNYGAN